MSKPRKKRNKAYTGQDAAPSHPTVHRYTAELRSPRQEWWHDHKRAITLSAKIGGGAIVVGWLLFEGARLIF